MHSSPGNRNEHRCSGRRTFLASHRPLPWRSHPGPCFPRARIPGADRRHGPPSDNLRPEERITKGHRSSSSVSNRPSGTRPQTGQRSGFPENRRFRSMRARCIDAGPTGIEPVSGASPDPRVKSPMLYLIALPIELSYGPASLSATPRVFDSERSCHLRSERTRERLCFIPFRSP